MKKYLFPIVFAIFIATSCTTDELYEPTNDNSEETLTRAGVGNEATSPYSLSKVQAAYNLVASSEGWQPIELQPTDLYVRFR